MSTESKPRVVLAYSGGLDTSCILRWLIEQGYDVVAYLADVGQEIDDLNKIKEKALAVGAVAAYVEDLKEEFVTDYVFPLLRSGAVYESRYLLGTSIARPIIAKRLVDIAHRENCQFVSHGATGKGNDQVRFELSVAALDSSIKTIAPWRMPEFLSKFKGRQELLAYAAEHGIEVDQTPKQSYSIDENLFHTSYESGMLEDPMTAPPAEMFRTTMDPLTSAADEPERIAISFLKGDPIKVENLDDGKVIENDPLALFQYINSLGYKHGVGRIDIVENRFVGIKNRGVYEQSGATVIRTALIDLEGVCMDREVLRIKEGLSAEFARLAYNGFWFSPEMDFLLGCINSAESLVDGTVYLTLYKGNVIVVGRTSKYTRYDAEIASMDEEGDFNPGDSTGFIAINSLRLKANRKLVDQINADDPSRLANSVLFAKKE